ncbi:MAG: peptidylprolyl isomerase, partial [Archangium sp.]|nr:peptidylprolyl isomerase [Archangium sp.]
AAAYAAAQSKSASARALLATCAQDDSSDVRSWCAKGLGDVGSDADVGALRRLLDDPDYRVAVEATRALAKLAQKCKGACPAISALADVSFRAERLLRGDVVGGGQPILALAQQGLPSAGRGQLVSLRQQLINAAAGIQDQRLQHSIATLECRLAMAIDRIQGTLTETLGCGGGLVPEAWRLSMGLRELAQNAPAELARRVNDFSSYLGHPDPKVRLAALELLGNAKVASVAEKIRPQLGSADLVVAAGAAAALAKLNDTASIPAIRQLAGKALLQADVAPIIAEALTMLDAREAEVDLEPWLYSTHVTIRAAAAEALTKLKRVPVSATRIERLVETVKRPSLPQKPKLVINTDKGEFEVALFEKDAPLTSLNIYTLAKRNFFRGLTFHRVVPDFVVQGGDPRGDGEGGPGYTIRCEVNRRVYARGVVGMALSGKDTGGSQFFVTASPQPHLDGRYTAFGEVTKGQEVVDALLEGDSIIEVRASP